ncbi:hypothetical protein BDN70DRAFT_890308 [Pholiota conissans]|uniref:Transcription activator GCR1-like domain-containing protein n=1 Tax=Pholiota conissans TaxID=109636 RepID=A0A9P6D6X9_9AGAR|nr:hypothetical protein BDN70DRAFT_890308 [Pholiota conissans]
MTNSAPYMGNAPQASSSPPKSRQLDAPNDDSEARLIHAIIEGNVETVDQVHERSLSSPPRRARHTEGGLFLPPALAFVKPNSSEQVFPSILTKPSVTLDEVLNVIERPEMLWDCWGPQSLDYYDLSDLWAAYTCGGNAFDYDGNHLGAKPPLEALEKKFKSKWRKLAKPKTAWGRIRMIPEYIISESNARDVSPRVIMDELEALRDLDGGEPCGLSALSKLLKAHISGRLQAQTNATDANTEDTNGNVDPPSGSKKRKAQGCILRQSDKKKKFVF